MNDALLIEANIVQGYHTVISSQQIYCVSLLDIKYYSIAI